MLTITRLPSGYYHIRGHGPCEWAQPPIWPCSEDVLRSHAFSQASEHFLQQAIRAARHASEEPNER